ncbi:MAG: M23 family metallopeptidase [Treponemataceae bacterium]|nr:M23 family metallopeptidase [Treponemataceae bacterium]
MARTRQYKRLEKNAFSSFLQTMRRFFAAIGNAFSRLFKLFDSKLTIMVVPHAKGKVVNFQTNVFALALTAVLVIGIISSFVYFNRQAAGSGAEISRLMNENRQTLASLDELRDENNNLLQTAKRFRTSLSQALSLIGISQSGDIARASMSGGDLSSLFDTQEQVFGATQEANDIRLLNAYIENAIQPIEEIGKMLKNQETLFSDIPNIWPIRGGIGHISMQFGQNEHPITGQWYIHKGLDFSTYRSGDPIVATANGQVVNAYYDPSFGNNVIIKHKHGIYTRYCHMSRISVQKGQLVTQRQVIGNIGNTGITTGPHLHYEVHIGSDVVDPAKYVNVKLTTK